VFGTEAPFEGGTLSSSSSVKLPTTGTIKDIGGERKIKKSRLEKRLHKKVEKSREKCSQLSN